MYQEVQSEPILFRNVLWKRVEPVASNFCPPSCINTRHYLAFKLREAVRHMSSSFSFKHNATKVQKLFDMVSCSLIFKLRLLFQSFSMLVCSQNPWLQTILMKIIMQFRTNVNYMANASNCLIEICNTHTITFGCQTHFLSQNAFKLQLARNAFDSLLWA